LRGIYKEKRKGQGKKEGERGTGKGVEGQTSLSFRTKILATALYQKVVGSTPGQIAIKWLPLGWVPRYIDIEVNHLST